jgi:Fic-DOC domain mobile mystery protein B
MSDTGDDDVPAIGAQLTVDELEGLIPTYIASRADLDHAIHANIEAATRWAFGKRRVTTPEQLLTIDLCHRVHRRMFGDVWRGAGQLRTVGGVEGAEPKWIAHRLRVLFNDARHWHVHDLHAPADRAVQLHHGLLKVHPYREGNEQHARFMADLYLHLIGAQRLEWSTAQGLDATEAARRADPTALQHALDRLMHGSLNPGHNTNHDTIHDTSAG